MTAAFGSNHLLVGEFHLRWSPLEEMCKQTDLVSYMSFLSQGPSVNMAAAKMTKNNRSSAFFYAQCMTASVSSVNISASFVAVNLSGGTLLWFSPQSPSIHYTQSHLVLLYDFGVIWGHQEMCTIYVPYIRFHVNHVSHVRHGTWKTQKSFNKLT